MNLAAEALRRRPVSYFGVLLVLVGGIYAYFNLGQLEDPDFTVKTASISTVYPGASAEQVELEVTDRIELKLQEMGEIKQIYSTSQAGLSIIKVDINDEYWSDVLPQIWDVLRKKIREVETTLPPGAGRPQVGDDFGNVYGFLVAVTRDEGFTQAELQEQVKALRKELSLVKGVARVDTWGEQQRRVYVDVTESQLTQLGLSLEQFQATLQQQNAVVNAGGVGYQDKRMRLAPTGEFAAPADIGEVALTGGPTGQGSGNELIRLRDFATVYEGYADPPRTIFRFNERPAVGVSISPTAGANVVEVGRALDRRIAELQADLPLGIEIERVAWQSDLVDASIQSFMINLAEAVAIVLVVLALTMGWRAGVIIGVTGLIFPILGTLIVMWLMGIDLHRISLGAMIIAMGMMVDNAIVVVDGIIVRFEAGQPRESAAVEAASGPAMALLGATIVACLAFFPIYISPVSTGEYAGSLFTVVGISLLLSWLFSQTVTPLVCLWVLPEVEPREEGEEEDAYGGPFYGLLRRALGVAIRFRYAFLGGMVVLLALAIFSFQFVPVLFFPDASRAQIMIDYWAPEGTRIEEVSRDVARFEQALLAEPEVADVSAFIGAGPPRFYLPVAPESPNSAYAQIIVNTPSTAEIEAALHFARKYADEKIPNALVRVRKYAVGSFNDWKIEARFSGPANADLDTLRDLAEQGMEILRDSPHATEVRTNWRGRIEEIVPEYNQERGRWAAITRPDLAAAFQRAYDGNPVGQYRERDELIPIVLRLVPEERAAAATRLETLQVMSAFRKTPVPAGQVLDDVDRRWVDSIIRRWNRRRAITVQCSPVEGVTAPTLRDEVVAEFEKIPLPPGYELVWWGEYNSSQESNQALIPGLVPAFILMVLICVVLFNGYIEPLVIFLVIPFVMIGITSGHLMTQIPFGFMALLGGMSLSGMMVKNVVVLLDEVNANLELGKTRYQSVIDAAVSRFRPVLNAAATTVLGMAPLLLDVFWQAMAVTIMFGLAVGTVLTMIVAPVLYATLYRAEVDETPRESEEAVGPEPA